MTTQRKTHPNTARADEADLYPGFDVTCVIGHVDVTYDGSGEPPHVVAFKMIAMHDAPGTFSFPMPDGRTNVVTVEFV